MSGNTTRRNALASRVERAVEEILDHVAARPPAAYRESLLRVAAALRAEADEIEALANDRTTK